nr:hypothetical protein [Phycicoccus sp. HDW14]
MSWVPGVKPTTTRVGSPTARASTAKAVANCSEPPACAPVVPFAPSRKVWMRRYDEPPGAVGSRVRVPRTAASTALARAKGAPVPSTADSAYFCSPSGSPGVARRPVTAVASGRPAAAAAAWSGASTRPSARYAVPLAARGSMSEPESTSTSAPARSTLCGEPLTGSHGAGRLTIVTCASTSAWRSPGGSAASASPSGRKAEGAAHAAPSYSVRTARCSGKTGPSTVNSSRCGSRAHASSIGIGLATTTSVTGGSTTRRGSKASSRASTAPPTTSGTDTKARATDATTTSRPRRTDAPAAPERAERLGASAAPAATATATGRSSSPQPRTVTTTRAAASTPYGSAVPAVRAAAATCSSAAPTGALARSREGRASRTPTSTASIPVSSTLGASRSGAAGAGRGPVTRRGTASASSCHGASTAPASPARSSSVVPSTRRASAARVVTSVELRRARPARTTSTPAAAVTASTTGGSHPR